MQWHSEPDGGQFRELMPGAEGNNERSPWNMERAYGLPGFAQEVLYWHRLREALLPYLRETARECAREGRPMLRPLVYYWPEDERALDCEDEFLLGRDLLVAPLLEEGARGRRVYLPEGRWRDLFSLQLGPGDRAVLIGEEGNGKSTLLKLIHEPASVEGYAEWSGAVSPGGRTGYLPQELPQARLSEPARLLFERSRGFAALTPRQRHALAAELGLDAAMFASERPLRSFSGGERVKLQLAALAAEEPELYLLDEPSNDLDLYSLEWLEDFILSRKEPVLFVSHDETLIERTANVVVHLELLRRKTLPRATVARLPYRDYVEARSRGLARLEQAARKQREEFDKRLERYRQIRQKVESAQAGVSRQDPHSGRLLKKKMHSVQAMGRRFEKEREALTALPETEEAIFLSFPGGAAIPNGKRVLELSLPTLEAGGRVLSRGVELRVTGPERVGIVGRNGAGKTTLLRS